MHKQASDRQVTLGLESHLAVVATKIPKRITRTLLTTVIVSADILQLVSGAQLSVTVAENLPG